MTLDTEDIDDTDLGAEEANASYRTILGFDTANRVSARMIDVAYIFAIVAAFWYAYHGFQAILGEGASMIMLGVISTAVVLLPYALKIALFGRRTFPVSVLALCLLVSSAPLLFDFFGLYSWSGGRTVLAQEKESAITTVNDFNVAARRKIGDAEGAINVQRQKDLAEIDQDLQTQLAAFERRVINARHLVSEEASGVLTSQTSGTVGYGVQARANEAAASREQDMLTTNRAAAEKTAQSQRDQVNAVADGHIENLEAAVAILDKLVPSDRVREDRDVASGKDAEEPAVAQIADAQSFEQLGRSAQRANSLMASAAAQARAGAPEFSQEVVDVKPFTGDIFEMSVLALWQGKIAAWVSLLVAFLLEWIDSIVSFTIRLIQGKEDERIRRLRARIKELTDRNTELEALVPTHLATPTGPRKVVPE